MSLVLQTTIPLKYDWMDSVLWNRGCTFNDIFVVLSVIGSWNKNCKENFFVIKVSLDQFINCSKIQPWGRPAFTNLKVTNQQVYGKYISLHEHTLPAFSENL